ncbi:GntR family transcriptional regulator [Anaerocolumna aminovalerica]|jgi:DNA-binding GntR family transcriptional regulator|uniref:DNA-binding transcriptional regulator, GntR family n=1 Tax=Anaerocolumna aminovalerica TaxID=1527 RepID=A0A1I5C3V9_9FIRM|nr:GntR family transcriptional regulator [Anaerocolumna aminovalerica]MDU6263012.1 GntR family transcriptional regulator [Anaerocolumna aminovalerica]SFN81556.1 DNA-binding transcriptional regulator, GntR family [Anaerocolumna aminovalerica]
MKKSETLKDKIYNDVFDGIIKGEYLSDQILSEKSLMEKFKTSKAPVREALIELCNEGILRSIPRYGYEIIKLTDKDVSDIQKFRIILECECLSRYWDMITPDHIAQLEQIITEDYANCTEYNAIVHWENNSRFHLLLMSFFKNQYIYNTIKSSLSILTRAYAQFYWDKWHTTQFKTSAECHEKFIKCLKSNDKYGAIKALEWDLSGFHEKTI